VSGSGISWAICKPAPHSRQITIPAHHHSVFTGRMPFLPPNQQRQSTEGTDKRMFFAGCFGDVTKCSVAFPLISRPCNNCQRLSFRGLRVWLSQPYIAAGHTSAFISCIFVEIGMLWLFYIFCSDAPIACPLFNLVRNSVVHSPSSVIRDPRYGNVSTCSSCSV